MLTPCTDAHHPASPERGGLPTLEPLVLTAEGDGRGPWARTWARVPTAGYVTYVILDRAGDALYVGQTRRPRERLREHSKNYHALWRHTAIVLLFPAASEVDARMAEAGLIDRLRPPLNGRQGRLARGEWGRIRNLLAAEYDTVGAL